MPALLDAGTRVLRFDNRGIGKTDAPAGPYTSRLLADDAKALVDHLGITDFHLMGVSMGGMIVQEYALAYGVGPPVPHAGLHLRRARAVLLPHVRDVGRHGAGAWASRSSCATSTLWAFTVPFFAERPDDAREFEEAMAALDMAVEAYLAQLNVIQTHDTTDRLAGSSRRRPSSWPGEEDILIPVRLSQALQRPRPGLAVGDHSRRSRLPVGAPRAFNATLIDFIAHTRTNPQEMPMNASRQRRRTRRVEAWFDGRASSEPPR